MKKVPRRILKTILAPVLTPIRALHLSATMFNRYYRRRVISILSTSFSRPNELSNFTYDLTPLNLIQLAHIVAVVTGRPVREIHGYLDEAREDAELNAAVNRGLEPHGHAGRGVRCPFGRRLGWYAFVRAMKPAVVVETGVDRGHGSLILCAALLRNAAEGRLGRYYGTDIDPNAGWLLTGRYAQMGKILYGDSIESLKALNETVDIFINDSDHSMEYECREYQIIQPKLSASAIILGDNAHTNDGLARYAEERGRNFLFFKEEPASHWYPGGGIGISFPARGLDGTPRVQT